MKKIRGAGIECPRLIHFPFIHNIMKKYFIAVRFQYQSINGPTWSEWIRVPNLPIVSDREQLKSTLASRRQLASMETKHEHTRREYTIIETESEQ